MWCDWCFVKINPESQIVAMTMLGVPVVFCKKCYWDREKAQARKEIERLEDEENNEVLV